MDLDADLVCDAQAARERLIKSQRAAEQTRANFTRDPQVARGGWIVA